MSNSKAHGKFNKHLVSCCPTFLTYGLAVIVQRNHHTLHPVGALPLLSLCDRSCSLFDAVVPETDLVSHVFNVFLPCIIELFLEGRLRSDLVQDSSTALLWKPASDGFGAVLTAAACWLLLEDAEFFHPSCELIRSWTGW